MKWVKLFESFYKYKDHIGSGAEHKAYYIDDNWILKMSKKSDYTTNKERLINFNNHIRIMNKYLDNYIELRWKR